MEASERHFTVKIMPPARKRMSEHFMFLARVNVVAAEKLLQTLLADMRSLEYLPNRHPFYQRPGLTPNTYRFMISAKRYRLVYRVTNNIVFIDDIQDCRQENDKNIV